MHDNIINNRVNVYIDKIGHDFKSDINIETRIINEGDIKFVDYAKARQSILVKKAENLMWLSLTLEYK